MEIIQKLHLVALERKFQLSAESNPRLHWFCFTLSGDCSTLPLRLVKGIGKS